MYSLLGSLLPKLIPRILLLLHILRPRRLARDPLISLLLLPFLLALSQLLGWAFLRLRDRR